MLYIFIPLYKDIHGVGQTPSLRSVAFPRTRPSASLRGCGYPLRFAPGKCFDTGIATPFGLRSQRTSPRSPLRFDRADVGKRLGLSASGQGMRATWDAAASKYGAIDHLGGPRSREREPGEAPLPAEPLHPLATPVWISHPTTRQACGRPFGFVRYPHSATDAATVDKPSACPPRPCPARSTWISLRLTHLALAPPIV